MSKAHNITAEHRSQSRWNMTFATWSTQNNPRDYDLNSPDGLSFLNGEKSKEHVSHRKNKQGMHKLLVDMI